VQLDQTVEFNANSNYSLLFTVEGKAELGIYNSITAVESTWDDALPVNLYGYNTFGFQDGLYGNNLNLELYWDDNDAKLDRITSILDRADAIFISSSRQWGSIPRITERYPLTAEYYRALIGCPSVERIEWCYSIAEPGMFNGELGFELAAVFKMIPRSGICASTISFRKKPLRFTTTPKCLSFERAPIMMQPQCERF